MLYRHKTLDGEREVFLDPNAFSKDGMVGLRGMSFSGDTKYLAYAIAESGTDWAKIRIKNINTTKDLPEVLNEVKFTSIVWTKDSKGFFYNVREIIIYF